ncbi:MAG: phosphoribosylformylglycinamidine synthase subunit PurL [bacterium]|jgi:phosphoribosylformylglycinamidine synthase
MQSEGKHIPGGEITPALLARVGLTRDEYLRARELMGRDLTVVELGIFGAMWSEHCNYKSSKKHLRKLPSGGGAVLQGPGENAGVVDIGGGLAVAFKIESHNHPSAVEPFQGAATGIGGIVRDVFAMGARPVALLDPLRFGPISKLTAAEKAKIANSANGNAEEAIAREEATRARTKYLFGGVVSGIAHYGNCLGIPTVGGEVVFDESYSTNPLVNVLCLGVVEPEHIVKGTAGGEGNPILYVGAKTGRDGIQGATFASVNLAEDASQDRPAVQVGDPFYEKLLLEACLEVARMPGLIGMQDMGAAGLTSSTCEMAGRGGVGVELDLDKVPQRAEDMTAYEMMLSESQERMVLCVERGREQEFIAAFKKWELDAVEIGVVLSEPVYRVKHRGEIVAEIPNNLITKDVPEYDRPAAVPAYYSQMPVLYPDEVARIAIEFLANHEWPEALPHPPLNQPYAEFLFHLLAHPNIASKRTVWEQYDYMVRTGTVPPYDGDAAVVRVKQGPRAVAISTDCPAHACFLDPRAGAARAVCEAARNLIAVGARPLAITNCLNFGNPEDPEVMWQFTETIEGMRESLSALGTPVTGGNVSFYNETERFAVNPTPVIGMVGVLEDAARRIPQSFAKAGSALYLVGATDGTLDASSLAYYILGLTHGKLASPDYAEFAASRDFLLAAMDAGLVASCHDVSDGGLAVCAAEMAFGTGIGCEISVSGFIKGEPSDSGAEIKSEHLSGAFSESGNRWLVEVDADRIPDFEQLASHVRGGGDGKRGSESGTLSLSRVGSTGGDKLTMTVDTLRLYSVRLADAEEAWRRGMEAAGAG